MKWKILGYPTSLDIKEEHKLGEERIKKIVTELPSSKTKATFNSIMLEKFNISVLRNDQTSYVIVSDREDPVKARKKVLNELEEQISPQLDKLREGKKVKNLNEFMRQVITQHTRALSGARSSSASSTLLGVLGGFLFLFGFSWIERLLGRYVFNSQQFLFKTLIEEFIPYLSEHIEVFLPFLVENSLVINFLPSIMLLLGIITIFTGICSGVVSGSGVGGFLGSYLSFLVTSLLLTMLSFFELQNITTFLLDYYPILLYTEEIGGTNFEVTLLVLGLSFGLFAGLTGAAVGRRLDNGSLLAPQLPTKPGKKQERLEKEKKIEESKKTKEPKGPIEEVPEREMEELEDIFKT